MTDSDVHLAPAHIGRYVAAHKHLTDIAVDERSAFVELRHNCLSGRDAMRQAGDFVVSRYFDDLAISLTRVIDAIDRLELHQARVAKRARLKAARS